MSKLDPEVRHRCIGCNQEFDDAADLCHGPHHWPSGQGVTSGPLCEQCHVTALGKEPPHRFQQFDVPNKKVK